MPITINYQDGRTVESVNSRNIKEALEENKMDLRIAQARDVDLTGIDLSSAKAEGVDLSGSDMSDSKLSYVAGTGGLFTGVSFRNSDMAFIDLDGANLSGCDFTGCTFNNGRIADAILTGAVIDWSQHKFIYEFARRQMKVNDNSEYIDTWEIKTASLFLNQDAGGQVSLDTLLRTLSVEQLNWIVNACSSYTRAGDNAPSILRG